LDQPLNPEIIRKKRNRRIFIFFSAFAGIFLFGYLMISWIRPSIERSKIRTAKVEKGLIEASITSTGTVVPEFEQVISSSIESRILKVLKRPGDTVKKGEQILLLDVKEAQENFENLNDQLKLKENSAKKLSLELKNTIVKLESDIKLKSLEAQIAKAKLEQTQKLFEKMISSKNELQQSELEAARTQFSLDQLSDSRNNSETLTKVQLEGFQIEIDILKRDLQAAKRIVDLAAASAAQNGVLTWALQQEGSPVRKGDLIARVADLTSFEVKATVSDIHASRLQLGLPAKIKIDTTILTGQITNIQPTVENGIITVFIGLNDKSNKLLRSNLRVDISIITDYKDNVLMVKKGQFSTGGGINQVFVIKENEAVKTPVQFGLSGFEKNEVLSGLELGDEIIISNTENIIDYDKVKIENK